MPVTNTPPTKRFYPTLASVIDTDDIPEFLGFIKSGLISVLNKIHYKDLQYSKSPRGDAGFYSLSIVTKNRLDIEIPGTGIFFVLNPDQVNDSDTNISVFPISLEYEWKILAFIRDFNDLSFSSSPQEVFELALRVLNLNQEEVMAQFMNVFVTPIGTSTELEQYVADLNVSLLADTGGTLSAVTSSTTLRDVVEEVYTLSGDYSIYYGFATYILKQDLNETKENLKKFFKSLLPKDIEAYLADILLPKINTTVTLSAGIEFPRNLLKPVYDENGNNPFNSNDIGTPFKVIAEDNSGYPRVMLTFGEMLFYADTRRGFGYELDLVLNTTTHAQIGKTPLIISLTNAKIDLSDQTNIAEATADGRNNNFKGVYIEEAAITLSLDEEKFPDAAGVSLYTKNLLVGSEGGISGTVGIQSDMVTHPQYWSNLILDSTPNIEYDYSRQSLIVRGSKKEASGLVLDDPIGTVEPEFVPMPLGDIIDIRDAENNYYRITRSNETITVVPQTMSFSPLSIKFGGNGTSNETDANVISLNNFAVTFHQGTIVHTDISGSLYMPQVSGGTTIDIDVDIANGFHVTFKSNPSFEVTDNSIFKLSLDYLQIQDTEDFFQVALGNIFPPELGGTLTNNIDIPFANKFIPKTFSFDYLAYKKYKSSYTGNTDDQGFNYSLLFSWENGLSIPISNLGTSISQVEFRRRFEIAKKKEDGFFKLDAIELVVKPETPDGISAALEFYGAQFNIGKKISFTIDGLGLKVLFAEAASNKGQIGPFDTSFEITGPKGIGVSIDAGAVKGTGYLYIDDDEYRGLVQLEISEKFSVTAVAVLNTRMPNGEKGNSFITIISITGLDIQLGMGFVLDGLGGILGIHRTMDTQFLRDGIRNGTMDSLLFPDNVEENLTQIISDIKSVYPMKRDQFIFGPMAKLYWGGVKAVVEADLALLIEFSDPTRLIVLGKAIIGIAVGNVNLILIQVGVLAELNFTEKKLMIDASIYNSKLLAFTLEGDMALRLYWGDEKAFLLTVGGFHPDYKPSENMKVDNVRRMKIALLNDNPRLTIEAYFAVTSNTVQFGSSVDFYFELESFIIKGGFGFDCLFQFDPFQFTVGVYAYLGIYAGTSELMGISLSGSLKGTTPWSISGAVEFKILGFKVKGRVDKTWGDNMNTSLPAVQVNDLVIAALADDKSWKTTIPDQRYFLVGLSDNSKLAQDANGDPVLLMSPMSTLSISQDVVPLDVTLNHYYNQKVSGTDKFEMNNIVIGSDIYSGADLTKTKTDFAPAQYFAYTDKQKLSKSSFENMVNGVSLQGNGELQAEHVVDMDYNYDMTLYDGQPSSDPNWLWLNERSLDSVFAHDILAVDEFVKGGFISNNAQSRTNRYQSETVEGNVVSVVDDFVIVNKNTFDAHNNDMATYSVADLSAAEDLVSELLANDPDLEGELMVVQKHELV